MELEFLKVGLVGDGLVTTLPSHDAMLDDRTGQDTAGQAEAQYWSFVFFLCVCIIILWYGQVVTRAV